MRDDDQYTLISSSPDLRTYKSEQWDRYNAPWSNLPVIMMFCVGIVLLAATQSDILVICAVGWIGIILEVLFLTGVLPRATDWPKHWPKKWASEEPDRTSARLLD